MCRARSGAEQPDSQVHPPGFKCTRPVFGAPIRTQPRSCVALTRSPKWAQKNSYIFPTKLPALHTQVWYYPNEVYGDKELLAKTKYTKADSDFGQVTGSPHHTASEAQHCLAPPLPAGGLHDLPHVGVACLFKEHEADFGQVAGSPNYAVAEGQHTQGAGPRLAPPLPVLILPVASLAATRRPDLSPLTCARSASAAPNEQSCEVPGRWQFILAP